MRHTGIPIIGDVPWGTHFCQFYQDKQDLIDILVPYFKAGLEENEFCMWVTSEPLLGMEEARAALARVVEDLDGYIAKGQIEFLDYSEWYTIGGKFESDRVLKSWVERLDSAKSRGFDGLRLTGNTFWLEKSNWQDFAEYDAALDGVIGQYRMLAICTYSLATYGAVEIMEVVSNHSLALIKRAGEWQIIENGGRKRALASLRGSDLDHRRQREFLETLLANAPYGISVHKGRDIRYVLVNRAYQAMVGSDVQLIGRPYGEVFPEAAAAGAEAELKQVIESGKPWVVHRYKAPIPGKHNAMFEGQVVRLPAAPDDEPSILSMVWDVTEQATAEEAAREHETQFRTLANAIPQLCWMANADGWIFWYNQRWYEYTGTTPRQMEGWGWQSVHDPEALPEVLERWKGSIASGQPFDMVFPLRGADGVFRPFLTRVMPVKGADGKVVRWFGTNTDVSEQKKTEEALRESEDRFRSLFEHAAVGIKQVDLNGSLIAANPALCRMLGYSEGEILGKHFREFTHPDDREREQGQIDLLLRGQREFINIELRYLHRQGNAIWVMLSSSVVKDPAGNPLYRISVVQDIDSSKRAEEALRESEERFRVAQELSPDGFLIFRPLRDSAGVVTDFLWIYENDAAARMNDTNPTEVCGKRVSDVLPQHDKSPFHKVYKEVAETGQVRVIEEAVYGQDTFRQRRWFRVVAVPSGGDVAILVQNVTERKRAEEALRQSEERQRFLVQLGDALRPLGDPLQIQFEAARVLGEHLSAGRVGYAECEGDGGRVVIGRHYTNGLSSIEGNYRLEDFGSTILTDLQAGRVWESGDVANDPKLSDVQKANFAALPLGALADFPLVKEGRLAAILFAHFGEAHAFNAAEISLMEAVAERTWAAVERARAEEALRQSLERLERVLEVETVGVMFWDLNTGCMVDANDAFLKLTGYSRSEVEARELTWQKLTPPDYMDVSRAEVEKFLATGRVGPYEKEYFRKDGTRRWLLFAGSSLGNNQCVEFCVDISGRKKVEKALAASESRLRALLESASQGVVAVDERGHMILVNAKIEEMFGYTRDELQGQPLNILLPERYRDVHAEHVRHYFANPRTRGMGLGLALYGRTKDGAQFPLEVSLSCIEEGGSRLAMALITDITERKKSEERLWQAQKLESIGLLAGGVAHDFNNLLVGVIGNASLAREMMEPVQEAVELLDGVIRTGEQLAHLTRQMLAYSGKGRFLVEPLDLSDLLPEMSGLVQPSIPKKIAVHLDLEPHLPLVEADRGQLQQIFMNLVINAAEAIGSDAGLISVKTGTQQVDEAYIRSTADASDLHPGNYVTLEVRDTGCGMDEATKARIFDPFYSTKFTGRGLGLAAVAGIVRSHKGAIKVASTPGKGSCFTVFFPAVQGQAAVSTPHSRRAALHGTGTILVVDDEKTVRELAKKALERYGYKVLLADSGMAAIDIFKRHPGDISLVILDLSMPEMGGDEALPELRKLRPDVKIMVSSGYSESETLAFFRGQLVSGFVQKPYTATVLAEKAKAMLG